MDIHSGCDHLHRHCEVAPRPENSHHVWAEGEQAEYDSLAAKGRRGYGGLRWFDGKSHSEAFALALEAHGHNHSFLHRDELLAQYRADVQRVHPTIAPRRLDKLVEAYGKVL